MNKRKKRSSTLFLAILCAISMAFTVFAGTASPAAVPGGHAGGPGQDTAEVIVGNAAKPGAAAEALKQGTSLGIFTTTGYCNCSTCSSGHSLTYSGTVPKASHTISADIDLFPMGTRLMIHGTVYTVEDIGSAVDGNKVDIYYDSHEEALAHGTKQEEVFMVE